MSANRTPTRPATPRPETARDDLLIAALASGMSAEMMVERLLDRYAGDRT